MSLGLIDHLATTEPLAGIFSDTGVLGALLHFETALARVQARLGVIPPAAADAIARAAVVEAFDPETIARAGRASATVVLPLVEALAARVRALDPSAAAFVHWGATSQDAMDTALALCLSRAAPVLRADHDRLVAALRRLSDAHAGSVMLGRTLLQPASPITFGLKAAGWFAAVSRTGARVLAAFEEACVLQFGGAAGTLGALGVDGPRIAAELARELGLRDPGAAWHAHRDRLASLVAACGVYTGALAKIARDVALLMQPEVAEVSEPGGQSSAMPHKRNPAGCAAALAAAGRLPGLVAAMLSGMPQEHERGLGGWQADAASVAAAVQATGATLASMAEVIDGLRVDPARMRANLTATRGLVFAERAMMWLAPTLGRDAAGRIVAEAVAATGRGGVGFAEALVAGLSAAGVQAPADLASLTSADAYLSAAEELRLRLLDTDRSEPTRRGGR